MAAALKWFRKLMKKILSPESRRRSLCGRHALLLERLEDRIVPTHTVSDLAFFKGVNGQYPYGDLLGDSSGNLFGTTNQGGNDHDGTLFEWVKSTGAISILASFNGSNGESPNGGLVEDANGNLFGTANDGGAHRDGTLFEWVKSSGAISVLASFSGGNGARPAGGLVEDTTGNLFGTTGLGGSHGDGAVFEWVKNSHTIAVLASFNGANGKFPSDLTADSSGNLFGTTARSGAHGAGTVFEWVKSSGAIALLASFQASPGGALAHYSALVEDGSGNLFGTSEFGGSGYGSVFEWVRSSGTITDLASFDGSTNAFPYGGLVEDGSGNLFGTTSQGGIYGVGTVFEWVKSSGTISDLASFNGFDGNEPQTGLVEDSSGNLFGTTAMGGTDGQTGAVFEWVKSTGVLSHLASFNGSQGGGPLAGVVEDTSGNLFGTTSGGGTQGDGTVFEWVQSSRTVSVLASFDGANGAFPSGLIEDESGNLFGTTSGGGTQGGGTVFEWVKSSGTISVLASFGGPGAAYPSDLVEDGSGNLFGTTSYGGTDGYGTLFEWVKSSGAISVLVSFNGANGAYPNGNLVEDSSGNLFGTTNGGGTKDYGTVFEWVKSGRTISVLASFKGSNGAYPSAGLVEDSSGNLFGTTSGTDSVSGTDKYGKVFEWVKSTGTISVLASFKGPFRAEPSDLIEDESGNLFGTTAADGKYASGTAFEWVKSSHTLSVLAVFSPSIGQIPEAGLIEDSSGNFFGTTSAGGGRNDSGSGTLFEIANITLHPATLPAGAVGSSYGPVTIAATGSSGAFTFTLGKGNKLPSGLTLSSGGVLSGTPKSTGHFSFTIVATDTSDQHLTGKLKYSLTVSPKRAAKPATMAFLNADIIA